MSKTIRVDCLTRVEGEGGIRIKFDGHEPKSVELRIFEAPRFFEALLRGRAYHEAPDITARVCGICPVAYQMSACYALESAFGMELPPELHRLRRLLYCGEWIQSHALHMFMLHAPDLLGFPDLFEMSESHPGLVEDGLAVRKTGNALMSILGGRPVHPINVRVGGFYRVPDREELLGLLPGLEHSLEAMMRRTVELAQLDTYSLVRDYTFVGLRHPSEYPLCGGRIVSSHGLDIAPEEFEQRFQETQVERSTALHCTLDGGTYLCGPMARVRLNFDRLGPAAQETAHKALLDTSLDNPFRSIVARGIEVIEALEEALRLIRSYQVPEVTWLKPEVRAARGVACTEAPRGILYHLYEVDDAGIIQRARIVPPTSQNQRAMEEDLWQLAPELARQPHAHATRLAEQAIRNHDPCMSCATHAVNLDFG